MRNCYLEIKVNYMSLEWNVSAYLKSHLKTGVPFKSFKKVCLCASQKQLVGDMQENYFQIHFN